MTDLRIVWVAVSLAWLCLMAPQADGQRAQGNIAVFRGGSQSFLGVGVAEINAERANELKLKEERGVEVTRVESGSPAEKAGIKVHDVVLEYDGQRVEGGEQFVRLVRETPSGRAARLSISRDGQLQTISATIDSRRAKLADPQSFEFDLPERGSIRVPDIPNAMLGWRNPALGVEAESLGSQLAEFFGVKEGVLVRSVAKESAAEKAGIRAGDVIVRVGDEKVTSPMEVSRAVRSEKKRQDVPVTVIRDKREVTVTVRVDSAERPWRPRGTVVRMNDAEL